VLLALLCAAVQANQTAVIQTKNGPVQGIVADNGVQRFFGIPFAAPPVGKLRFQRPQPPQTWSSVRQCVEPAASCPQYLVGNLELGHEDCLYLDIYLPPNFDPLGPTKLPVMFWIYGGGFTMGDALEFGMYNGKYLVEHGVILVAVNYRLGSLGYLALDELKAEDPQGSTGNYGMLDQTTGLQWVHDNIGAFGGNASRVTVFGESAGAFSTCWHLASPTSKGLFQAAIMESGTCDSHMFYPSYSDAVSFSHFFLQSYNCNQTGAALLACIRNLSVHDLVTVKADIKPFAGYHPPLYPEMPWGMTIDKVTTLDLPLNRIKQGLGNNVPLIIGTNHDEGTAFVGAMTSVVGNVTFPISDAELVRILQHFFTPAQVTQIQAQYAKPAQCKYNVECLSLVLRDYFFLCASRRVARTFAANHIPVYLYQFVYNKDFIWKTPLGDFHASELFFVFDDYEALHFTQNDIDMSKSFQDYWTNHAKFGNPSPGGNASLLSWPQWTPDTESNVVMDVPLAVNTHLETSHCDFWDTITPA